MNKTKRRIFTAIISCFLALTMVFSVACGGDSSGGSSSGNGGTSGDGGSTGGGDNPSEVSDPYTVTVTYAADNTPVTSSSIQVVFTATSGGATVSYPLGADGTLSVPYETLNTAITTSTKRVTLTGVPTNYEVVSGTYSVSSGSRSVSISIIRNSYTVSVLGTDGNAYTNSSGVNVVFYDADTDATYTTPLTASGSVVVDFSTLTSNNITSSTVYARLTGVDASLYSGLATLSTNARTGTINITTRTEIHDLYDEYAAVYPVKTQSIEIWLLKILNGSILPSRNQATAVSFDGTTATITAPTPTTYTVKVESGNLVITAANNTAYTIAKYTAEVKDQNGNAVENAYVRLTFYRSPDTVTAFNSYSTANGDVIFYALADHPYSYRVQIQDFSLDDPDRPSTITQPLPAGYSAPTTNFGIVQYPTGETNVEFVLNYYPSNFNSAVSKVNHNYARYIYGTAENGVFGTGAKLSNVAERNTDLTVNVEANVYSYVSFSPYVEPGVGPDGGSENTDARQAEADRVSAGKYKITLVTTNENARLIYFSSTFSLSTPDGVPTTIGAITGNGDNELYTGQDYIELELRIYNNENRNVHWFGIVSNNDCTATITVERTGDAVEPAAADVHVVNATGPLTQYSFPSGTVTSIRNDMPIDGNYTAERGSDGYYHVNSATGPLLYVQLTRNMQRLFSETNITLQTLPDLYTFGNKCYQFSVYNNSQNPELVTDIYDYVQFVADYCKVADTSTGLYPVNDEIKTFLEYLASTSMGACLNTAATGYGWLSYCQYVGEVLAPGSGTEERPYTLVLGNSNVTIGTSGTTYTRITLNAGVYTLAAIDQDEEPLATPAFAYIGSLACITSENSLIITVQSDNTEVRLTISGDEGEYKVRVGVSGVYEPHIIDKQQGIEEDLGISEETAIRINAPGVFAIHSLSESLEGNEYVYTYIKLSAATSFEAGTYELIVNGTGTLEYDNQTYTAGQVCTVTLTAAAADTPITIKIKSEDADGYVDSYVMLIARRVTAS